MRFIIACIKAAIEFNRAMDYYMEMHKKAFGKPEKYKE